jgi:hypothetical protein
MGKMGNAYEILVTKSGNKIGYRSEDLDVDRKMILNCILNK